MLTTIMELVGLLFLGALLYVGDRVFGVGVKRWLWNSTHGPRNRMTKDREYGFIYGQLVRSRLVSVATLVLVQLVLGFFVFHLELLGEIVWSALATVFITGGTYLGPFLDSMFGVVDTSLGHIEGIEQRVHRGETTMGAEILGAARSTRDRFTGAGEPPPTPPPSSPVAPVEAPEPDPAAALRGYTDRRG
ncbi:MAG: hypothetical protein KW788_04190 [Candidatus Doudnabacteria bacterium]|nr:hypothetical protein [Candidatus Doudnabacteria bacterium]